MTYHLRILTPDGLRFDGQARSLTVPALCGQLGVLANHVNLVTALGTGTAKVVTEAGTRHALCQSGVLTVTDGEVRLLAASFEWAEAGEG